MGKPLDWKMGLMALDDYGKYYYVRAYCENCGHHGQIAVKKGVTKPRVVDCTECGCHTLKT